MSTMKKSGISLMLAALWLCASGSQSASQTYTVRDPGTTFTSLVSFDGANGEFPEAGLVQATDGNLYGTTYYGGASDDDGTVFKITPAGTLTTLHSFNTGDGAYSYATPVQATNGNLYGTTYVGGADGWGTVFKITPRGTFGSLASFDSMDGAEPLAGLVQASNGNLYGTTYMGGSKGDGEVFKITPSGTLTVLHNFGGTDGEYPYAALIQATDGNLYGTTLQGGTRGGYGSVFKITPSGTLTTLHSFCSPSSCTDGSFPQTGLVQASDGSFYGTTVLGGAYNNGTIFKLTPAGTFTTLYSVCSQSGCPDGNYLYAGLIQATDGNLYGMMQIGGANGYGTIFRITTTGTLTTLYSFCSESGCTDGKYPAGGLMQDTNGNLYGTTADGGANGDGTIFSLSVGLGPFVATQPIAAKVGAAVNILGTSLTGATSVSFNGAAAQFKVVSSSEITTTVPAGATTGEIKVVTPSGTLSSNVPFPVLP